MRKRLGFETIQNALYGKKTLLFTAVFAMLFLCHFPFSMQTLAEGKWVENAGAWQYEENGSLYKGWLFVNGAWYYLDPTTGNMKDGWIFDKETWYFLKTDSAEQGKMATGWTWVEGNCYYLKTNGAMASNETVEGYQLAAEGQWVDKGQVVFEKEKGYAKSYSAYLSKQEGGQSAVQSPAGNGQAVVAATKAIRGGGSGSGGSGGGGGASGASGTGGRSSSSSSSSGSGASASYSKSSATTGSHSASVDSTTNTPAKDKTDSKKEKGSTVEEKKEHQELPPVNEGQPEGKEETGKEKKDKHNEKREEKKEEEEKKGKTEKTEQEHQRDADKVERTLQRGKNQNTAQYRSSNGEIYTTFFVKGVSIPALESTDKGGDFLEKEEFGYFTRMASFVSGQGYFDTNKARNGQDKSVDRNLCFATTASNVLHWYLQENKEKIQNYIEENGDIVRRVGQKNYSLQAFLDQSEPDQWNSLIFEYFKLIYGNSESGFYTGPLVDLFLNGYTPNKPVNSEMDFKNMDSRGGFLYGLLGKRLQSDITRSFKWTFSEDIKHHLAEGHALCISYKILNYSHVVSLWGADFDEKGKLVGLYVTDSDDQDETGADPEIGLKYYRITYENGWPYLNNSLSDKDDGSPITALHSFRWIE